MSEDQGVESERAASDPRPGDGAGNGTAPGPIFISGRQHSGNTMTAVIFSMVPDCFVVNVEGWFFEHRGIVDRIKDPGRRARYIVDILRLEDADLSERTRRWLVAWHEAHPQAPSVETYRRANPRSPSHTRIMAPPCSYLKEV